MNKISVRILLLALVLTGAYMSSDTIIRKIFYPPEYDMAAGPGEDTVGKAFDHSTFSMLLKKHTTPEGRVRYAGFRKDKDLLHGYLKTLAEAKISELSKFEQIAFYINAYNAITIRLILDNEGIKSIREIPASNRWKANVWQIGGSTVSLEHIEHDILRRQYKENKVHFALVCAAMGCPGLPSRAYEGSSLQAMLKRQTLVFLQRADTMQFDEQTAILRVSSLFDWYRADFGSEERLLHFLADHTEAKTGEKIRSRYWKIRYLKYDWRLNSAD